MNKRYKVYMKTSMILHVQSNNMKLKFKKEISTT